MPEDPSSARDRQKQFSPAVWEKREFFSDGSVICDDGAAAHFASGTRGCGNGNKMRNIIRYIYIPANEIIVFKKIFAVIDPEYDGARHIQRRPAANTDDGIPAGFVVNFRSLVNI